MTRLLCRAMVVIMLVSIALLSLVPPTLRPVTAAPHSLEHLLVFAGVGIAFAVAYSVRWWTQARMLVLFAATIETAQLFVPGRHARWSDLAVNVAGACLGIAIAHAASRFSRSAARSDAPAERAPELR
jgi:VanZ family protein